MGPRPSPPSCGHTDRQTDALGAPGQPGRSSWALGAPSTHTGHPPAPRGLGPPLSPVPPRQAPPLGPAQPLQHAESPEHRHLHRAWAVSTSTPLPQTVPLGPCARREFGEVHSAARRASAQTPGLGQARTRPRGWGGGSGPGSPAGLTPPAQPGGWGAVLRPRCGSTQATSDRTVLGRGLPSHPAVAPLCLPQSTPDPLRGGVGSGASSWA